MKRSGERAGGVAAAFTVAGILATTLLSASPAQAAPTCTRFIETNTWAAATCQGAGAMRFRLTCNAVWPFQPWTKYSGWITTTSSKKDVVARFTACGWTTRLSGEYR